VRYLQHVRATGNQRQRREEKREELNDSYTHRGYASAFGVRARSQIEIGPATEG
jgi:hypothetical protein